MKYRCYINFMVYDQIEVEAASYDEAYAKVDKYVDGSPHNYDDVEIEVEQVEEEEEDE